MPRHSIISLSPPQPPLFHTPPPPLCDDEHQRPQHLPVVPARLGEQQLRALTPVQIQRLKQRAKSKKRNTENIIQDLLRLHPDGVPRIWLEDEHQDTESTIQDVKPDPDARRTSQQPCENPPSAAPAPRPNVTFLVPRDRTPLPPADGAVVLSRGTPVNAMTRGTETILIPRIPKSRPRRTIEGTTVGARAGPYETGRPDETILVSIPRNARRPARRPEENGYMLPPSEVIETVLDDGTIHIGRRNPDGTTRAAVEALLAQDTPGASSSRASAHAQTKMEPDGPQQAEEQIFHISENAYRLMNEILSEPWPSPLARPSTPPLPVPALTYPAAQYHLRKLAQLTTREAALDKDLAGTAARLAHAHAHANPFEGAARGSALRAEGEETGAMTTLTRGDALHAVVHVVEGLMGEWKSHGRVRKAPVWGEFEGEEWEEEEEVDDEEEDDEDDAVLLASTQPVGRDDDEVSLAATEPVPRRLTTLDLLGETRGTQLWGATRRRELAVRKRPTIDDEDAAASDYSDDSESEEDMLFHEGGAEMPFQDGGADWRVDAVLRLAAFAEYHCDPARMAEFQEKHAAELEAEAEVEDQDMDSAPESLPVQPEGQPQGSKKRARDEDEVVEAEAEARPFKKRLSWLLGA